ncbi:MAG: 4-hydroxy-tetrahydrodipicolinate reductase [Clostridiales bacterium]|nr:4-hydroxy-tetrahydrodipicolinate reductase [Clostridiales bacterium]
MIKLGIVGGTGKLGRDLIKFILKSNSDLLNHVIARKGNQFVGCDVSSLIGGSHVGVSVTDSIFDVPTSDVFVDCTNSEVFITNSLQQYVRLKKPVVIATTGFSNNDLAKIKEASQELPLLFSPNFSFGLYKFINTIKYAVADMDDETDIQIIEYHHAEKKDAPSGTAKRILEAILESNSKLSKRKINIASIRAGNIVGEHRVLIANNNDEQIELIHKVTSRESFSSGIVRGR